MQYLPYGEDDFKSDCLLFFKRKNHFSEEDLASVITACKEKNPQAQRCLIRQFAGYAKSISLRYTANSQEAEELINDGFLKVFLNLDRYDHELPFKAWLRTIMIHTAIDYYRKNQKWHQQVSIDDIEITDWGTDILSEISAQEILYLVQKLTPAYRMAFTLFVVEGFSHKEIAEMLNIQEGTSKSNLRDARRKLQAMIKLYYPHLYQLYNWPNRGFNAN